MAPPRISWLMPALCLLCCGHLAAPAASELIDAVKAADEPRIAEILKAHPEAVADRDPQNRTALIFGVAQNLSVKTLRLMVDSGTDLNAVDLWKNTALFRAAKNGRADVVAMLLAAGSDPSIVSTDQVGARQIAADNGKTDVVKVFDDFAAGKIPRAPPANPVVAAPPAGTPAPAHPANPLIPPGSSALLFDAVRRGDLAGLKALVQRQSDLNARDASGWAPLHCAVEGNSREIVELLIANRADPNAVHAPDGQTPLTIAADYGYTELVCLLLAARADPNARLSDGSTPLHRVAIGGFSDIAAYLLMNKADANARDKSGKTPADYAVANHRKQVLAVLVQAGAAVPPGTPADLLTAPVSAASPSPSGIVPPAAIPAGGSRVANPANRVVVTGTLGPGTPPTAADLTAINDAVIKGDLARVKQMIDANSALATTPCDHSYSTLHIAARRNNLDVLKYLLAIGVPVDFPTKYHRTPLEQAVEFNCMPAMEFLLDNGANLNAPDDENSSALFWAINTTEGDYVPIITALLKYGANPNLVNNVTGTTCLELAVQRGNLQVVQLLVDAGADASHENNAGKSPFDVARDANRQDLVQVLSRPATPVPPASTTPAALPASGVKADPTATLDPVQAKAFLDAILAKDWTRVLADLQANPNLAYAKDATGYTPLHLVAATARTDVAQKLLDLGVPIDIRHKFGRTPLHSAASEGHLAMVQFLIDHGADVNAVSSSNKTALYYCVASKDQTPVYQQIVAVLLQHKADLAIRDNEEKLTVLGLAKARNLDVFVTQLTQAGGKE